MSRFQQLFLSLGPGALNKFEFSRPHVLQKENFNQKSHIKWLNCFKMIIVEMTTLQDSLCLSIQISIVVARHQFVKFELPNRAPHVALSYEKDGL